MKKGMLVMVGLAGLLGGCAVTSYVNGPARFTRITVGMDADLAGLRVHVYPNGTRLLEIDGLDTVQTKGLGALSEGVTKGLISGIKPLP